MAGQAASEDAISMLVTTGYLEARDVAVAPKVRRAIIRFQRHAARPYRVPQPDAPQADCFTGKATGSLDPSTDAELRKWISRKWRVPIGRFRIVQLPIGGTSPVRLREDAAIAWAAICASAERAGATLGGNYGDSHRVVRPTAKIGTSRYSFHYCARAVDISQDYTLSKDHRYFILSEPIGSTQYWRIYCKTTRQDGSQGVLVRKGTLTHQQFHRVTSEPLPEGYYVDLTKLIESSRKFERIRAQAGWTSTYNKAEWWHFQYKLDKQATFLDEMELVGYSEQKLRACGWGADSLLDHAPG